jgi:DUF2961 family protein
MARLIALRPATEAREMLIGQGSLAGLAELRDFEWHRLSSYDGKGGNYVLLDADGDGQYVGCVLNVDVRDRQVNDWYGEGDDMIFIDGESWLPRLHGIGTEDYFAGTRCTGSTSRTRSGSGRRSG